MVRASVALWWKTDPFQIGRYPLRVFREMAEFKGRWEKAEADAYEAAKAGLPTPGRASRTKPQPGDEITDGQWSDRA